MMDNTQMVTRKFDVISVGAINERQVSVPRGSALQGVTDTYWGTISLLLLCCCYSLLLDIGLLFELQ
jgi:hypothetical protein